MKSKPDKIIALLLLTTMATLPALHASACAPVYPKAVIVSWSHPDLPLKSFAAGKLGIVQSSWARSYLCVVYRYLTNCDLNQSDQASVLRLWHMRLKDSMTMTSCDQVSDMEAYLTLRARALGINDKAFPDLYSKVSSLSYDQKIGNDAFANARQTLQERMKHYGRSSREVRQWIKGQDDVFGLNQAGKICVPPPPAKDFDKTLSEDRAYQIAAATLYLKDYARAATLFAQIAKDQHSPRSSLASYLTARCKVNDVIENGLGDEYLQTVSLIKSTISKEKNFERQQDLLDLIGALNSQEGTSDERFEHLVQSVSREHSEAFGRDVGDLTFIISESNNTDPAPTPAAGARQSKDDLTDWLMTISNPYDRYYKDDLERKKVISAKTSHALKMWRKNQSLHWLVAAMCLNGLRASDVKDALAAAKKIAPTSAAYLTANFYIVDALIAGNEKAEAKKRLQPILALAETTLPRSARNLFKAQQIALAGSADDYLQAATMVLPEASANELLLPANWQDLEKRSSAGPRLGAWDATIAEDLDRNLPFSVWLKLSGQHNLPPNIHARIVCATWLRALLLGKEAETKELSHTLAACYPSCAKKIQEYDSAPTGPSKQWALARLILENYGMSPYVGSGIPRMGQAINQFEWYQENFWLPLEPQDSAPAKEDSAFYHWGSIMESSDNQSANFMAGYYKTGIKRLLTAKEQHDAEKERVQLDKVHPSKLLGEAVLSWAPLHPEDPELPQLLYKVVKLPLWSGSSKTGSLYSKKAFQLLHSRYPHNKLTAKLQYSY